jgi:hypothetical protein
MDEKYWQRNRRHRFAVFSASQTHSCRSLRMGALIEGSRAQPQSAREDVDMALRGV